MPLSSFFVLPGLRYQISFLERFKRHNRPDPPRTDYAAVSSTVAAGLWPGGRGIAH